MVATELHHLVKFQLLDTKISEMHPNDRRITNRCTTELNNRDPLYFVVTKSKNVT